MSARDILPFTGQLKNRNRPMRRLFAVVLSTLLVFGFAPVAKADVAGLTPCAESARFQQRASAACNTPGESPV